MKIGRLSDICCCIFVVGLLFLFCFVFVWVFLGGSNCLFIQNKSLFYN